VLLVLLFLFFPVFCSHGGEHIVLYRLGMKEPVAWDQLRRYLGAKGYKISMYDVPDNIEKHVENVNKINKLKASALFAMDLGAGEKNQIIVAVTTTKKGKGNILAIEEIPALYANESRELATSLASVFNKGVKEFPLFPLQGVDMPSVFLKIGYTPDKTNEVFEKLHEGMQKYFKRGMKDER
jgi:N-acetylmuramoyl-L-alanine amidase